jgi:predicted NBD/HSP70 family sugar kinase
MYFATDIGGSKTRIASSFDCLNFDEPVIFDSYKKLSETLFKIKEIIIEKLNENENQKLEALIIGIAGTLNEDHSMLLRAPHILGFENLNIKSFFEKEFSGAQIFIENDTQIVGLGECFHGAGRGFSNLVYITVSTGIGGVKIVNGEFEINKFGFEPGHMILNADTGETWEDLASGTAIEKKFGMHPRDVAKTEHWPLIEKYIYEGLHNVILHWSPEILVIGGSMSRDLNIQRVKVGLSEIMKTHPSLPEIKLSELDSLGGIYGGFAYLKNKLEF